MFKSVFVCVLCTLATVPLQGRTDSTLSSTARWKRQINPSPAEENRVLEVFYNCKCVLYYQCVNGTVIQDGATLIDFREADEVTKSVRPCKGGEFEGQLRCCSLNSTDEIVTPPTQPILKQPEPASPNNNTSIPEKRECGVQRPIFMLKVFAGEPDLVATNGEFPWVAAIFKKDENNKYTFHCSGSLIHPQVVLTVNHHFTSKSSSQFKVIINGRVDIPNIGENESEERNVKEIVSHPEYYGGAAYNDVALLILDQPYFSSASNIINSICLPPKEYDLKDVRCLVAGWGKGSEIDGKKVMKKVDLPFVPFQKCKELLRKTALGEYFNLHKSFMCAGGEKGKDSCTGDGGGPLMCAFPNSRRYYQIGIVSWGVGCGEQDVPGVYSDVSVVREWILEKLTERHLSIEDRV